MARRQFQQRARKRVMSWQGSSFFFTNVTTAAAETAVVVSEAILENFPTPTLIRVRGRISVNYDVLTSAPSRGALVMGLIVIPATSISVPPSPLTDIGSDWLWWDVAPLNLTGSDSDETANNIVIDVDNKAMRKIGLNEIVSIVVHVVSFEGTSTINASGVLRFLLKAP